MTNKEDTINKILKEFREKWGRFYYSDSVGMDWVKPKKQNVSGIPLPESNGFCIASDDIEKDLKTSLEKAIKQEREKFLEEIIDEFGDMDSQGIFLRDLLKEKYDKKN